MNILVLNGSPKAHSTTLDMTKAFLNGLCQTEPGQNRDISNTFHRTTSTSNTARATCRAGFAKTASASSRMTT